MHRKLPPKMHGKVPPHGKLPQVPKGVSYRGKRRFIREHIGGYARELSVKEIAERTHTSTYFVRNALVQFIEIELRQGITPERLMEEYSGIYPSILNAISKRILGREVKLTAKRILTAYEEMGSVDMLASRWGLQKGKILRVLGEAGIPSEKIKITKKKTAKKTVRKMEPTRRDRGGMPGIEAKKGLPIATQIRIFGERAAGAGLIDLAREHKLTELEVSEAILNETKREHNEITKKAMPLEKIQSVLPAIERQIPIISAERKKFLVARNRKYREIIAARDSYGEIYLRRHGFDLRKSKILKSVKEKALTEEHNQLNEIYRRLDKELQLKQEEIGHLKRLMNK